MKPGISCCKLTPLAKRVAGSVGICGCGAGTPWLSKTFTSDGFILDTDNRKITGLLDRVIDTAARSGVSIYTVDSKGLTAGNVSASLDIAGYRDWEHQRTSPSRSPQMVRQWRVQMIPS